MDHMDHDGTLLHILLWTSPFFLTDSLKTLALVSRSVAECIHPELFRFMTITSSQIPTFHLLLSQPSGWRHAELVRFIRFLVTNKEDASLPETHDLVAIILSSLPLLLHVIIDSTSSSSTSFNLAPTFDSLALLERLRSLNLLGVAFDASSVTEESLRAVGSKLKSYRIPADSAAEDRMWCTLADASAGFLHTLTADVGYQPGQITLLRSIHFPNLKVLSMTSRSHSSFDVQPFISRHPDIEKLVCMQLSPTTATALHSLVHLTMLQFKEIPCLVSIIRSFPRPDLLHTLRVYLDPRLTSPKTFGEALVRLSNLEQLEIMDSNWFPNLWHNNYDETFQATLPLILPHPTLNIISLHLTPFAFAGFLPMHPYQINERKSCLEALYVDSPITSNESTAEEDAQIANDPAVRVLEETFLAWPGHAHASIIKVMREYAEASPGIEHVYWKPCHGTLDPSWEVQISIVRGEDGKDGGGVGIRVGFVFYTTKTRRNVRPEMGLVPGECAVVYEQPSKNSEIRNITTL